MLQFVHQFCKSFAAENILYIKDYFHSFIHSEDLYSALQENLLKGTPSPSPAIENRFQMLVKGLGRVSS